MISVNITEVISWYQRFRLPGGELHSLQIIISGCGPFVNARREISRQFP